MLHVCRLNQPGQRTDMVTNELQYKIAMALPRFRTMIGSDTTAQTVGIDNKTSFKVPMNTLAIDAILHLQR